MGNIGIEENSILSNSQCPNTEASQWQWEEVIIWSPADNKTHGQSVTTEEVQTKIR